MKDITGYKKCGSCRCYRKEDLYTSKFGYSLKTCEPCRMYGKSNYKKKDRSDEVRCARCKCFRTKDQYNDDKRDYKSCLKCRVFSRNQMRKKKQI